MAEDFQEAPHDQIERTLQTIHWNKNERIRLERECWEKDKKIASLEAEIKTLHAEYGKRIQYSERREASLDEDYQEARRELTVITAHADQIIDACQAMLAVAAVARHGLGAPKNNGKGIEEEIQELVANNLGIDRNNPPTPPATVHARRPSLLQKLVDDLENEPMPKFLQRGPMSPSEREIPPESKPSLRVLADMLSGQAPLVPEDQEPHK